MEHKIVDNSDGFKMKKKDVIRLQSKIIDSQDKIIQYYKDIVERNSIANVNFDNIDFIRIKNEEELVEDYKAKLEGGKIITTDYRPVYNGELQ